MKLTKENIQAAFNELATNPRSSLSQIAARLGCSKSALAYRLRQAYGQDYLARAKGSDGSLLRVLRAEYNDLDEQWINDNLAALTQPAGLLTANQEDRLTHTEVGHKRDYRGSMDVSPYLNDRAQNQFERVPFSSEPFISAPKEDRALQSSYIDRNDLLQVLQDFYTGSLNDCGPFTDRFYMTARELHPTNNLWSIVDAEMLEVCISQLTTLEAVSIAHHFTNDQIALEALTSTYVFTNYPSIDAFLSDALSLALDHLSNILLKVI